MIHRPSLFHPHLLGFEWKEKSLLNSLELLQFCCAEARDFHCGEADEMYLWLNTWQLIRARRQLDRCAALIYIKDTTLERCVWTTAVTR